MAKTGTTRHIVTMWLKLKLSTPTMPNWESPKEKGLQKLIRALECVQWRVQELSWASALTGKIGKYGIWRQDLNKEIGIKQSAGHALERDLGGGVLEGRRLVRKVKNTAERGVEVKGGRGG